MGLPSYMRSVVDRNVVMRPQCLVCGTVPPTLLYALIACRGTFLRLLRVLVY